MKIKVEKLQTLALDNHTFPLRTIIKFGIVGKVVLGTIRPCQFRFRLRITLDSFYARMEAPFMRKYRFDWPNFASDRSAKSHWPSPYRPRRGFPFLSFTKWRRPCSKVNSNLTFEYFDSICDNFALKILFSIIQKDR